MPFFCAAPISKGSLVGVFAALMLSLGPIAGSVTESGETASDGPGAPTNSGAAITGTPAGETTSASGPIAGYRLLRDSAGVWRFDWFDLRGDTIEIIIESPDPIAVKSAGTSMVTSYDTSKWITVLRLAVKEGAGTFEFSAPVIWFDIDVLLDGIRKPDEFYLGKHGARPSALPVRIRDISPYHTEREADAFGIVQGCEEGRPGIDTVAGPVIGPGQPEEVPQKGDHGRSDAMRLSDDMRGWPVIKPPDPRHIRPDYDPGDSAAMFIEVYNAATERIESIEPRGGERKDSKELMTPRLNTEHEH
jgi:hypothetical protein